MSLDPTRDIQTVLRERVVPANGSRHGLVVGIETYKDSRLNLRCAAADALDGSTPIPFSGGR